MGGVGSRYLREGCVAKMSTKPYGDGTKAIWGEYISCVDELFEGLSVWLLMTWLTVGGA